MYLGTKKPETATTQITIPSDSLPGIKLGATVPAALQGRKGLWHDGADWWIGNWYDSDSGKTGVNIAKIVFDGSEAFGIYASESKRFFYGYEIANSTQAPLKITYACTHFTPMRQVASATGLDDLHFLIRNDTKAIGFRCDIVDSVLDWKALLENNYTAGTPVTVYYVTATETISDIPSDALSALRSLTTLDGANNIMVNGSTVQPWLSVNYRQDLQKYVKDKLAALQAAIISLGGNI